MATLARVFHRDVTPRPAGPVAVQPSAGACALRALPHEDVVFFCKRIDNTRLVREPDPKARGACWHVIGAACLAAAALAVTSMPKVTATMDGYKLEALRAEERRLTDELRAVDFEEAQLLSPDRLDRLAKGHNLVTPANSQVYHLEGKPDGAVAMLKK